MAVLYPIMGLIEIAIVKDVLNEKRACGISTGEFSDITKNQYQHK